MSILYDFIFLFEGEPAQLLQSNCGRVSYPTFRGKFEHFLATYFEDKPIAQMSGLLEILYNQIDMCEVNCRNLSATSRSESKNVESHTKKFAGEIVTPVFRFFPTLMKIIRLATRKEYEPQMVKRKMLTNQISSIISEGLREMETNEKLIALPCYFLLRINEFCSEFRQLPQGDQVLENLLLQVLYLRDNEEQQVKKLRAKGRGVHHFLHLKGIQLIDDYTDY